MGYREDGMFGFVDKYPISSGITNPNFTYPTRSIRFLEAQAALDKVKDSYKLHRGYIRNLDQPALGKDFPVSKCKFQFNPQEIRQDVQMRQDVYHAILQDPAQLTQPLGAETSFSFDLVFDRSMELASGKTKGNYGDYNAVANINGSKGLNDVYDIGVLADLRVFYAVIGQGFSKEMLEFQTAAAKKAYETAEASGASAGSPAVEYLYDDEEIKKTLEVNYGNSAFLMPNPVRVMFSSLFMVDGFVTATSVAFLKFNTNMVPMQCKVTISMSAMYIGFAKQDTFLTTSFKDAAERKSAEDAELAAIKQEINTAAAKTLNIFKLAADGRDADNSGSGTWDKPIVNDAPSWAFGIKDSIEASNSDGFRTFYAGFPSVIPKEGGTTTNTNGVETRVGNDIDSILKLYEAGSSPTIAYSWSLNIYGPGAGATAGMSQATAAAALASKSYPSDTIKLMGAYAASETASSQDEWGYGESSPGDGAERIRRKTYLPKESWMPANSASDAWVERAYNDVPDYIKTSYYIVDIDISVSVRAGTEVATTKNATTSFVVYGQDTIGEHKFSLAWLASTPVIIVG
jgi:hypothetical protein